MKRLGVVLSLLFIIFSLSADKKSHKLNVILDKMDKMYRSKSAEFEMEMRVVTPNWKRTIKMKGWSKGMDKTFVTILSPKKDKGIGTLKVGKDMWNFFPKVNKIMKVPPSMMTGSWMGSDFTNDDLVKDSAYRKDYNSKLLKSSDKNIIVIQMIPKESIASVWGKIIARVRKRDYMTLTMEYYDEKGRKVRTMKFLNFKKMGGKLMPSTVEVVPLNKKGHITKIVYIKMAFDIKVKKSTFTLRNLQKMR